MEDTTFTPDETMPTDEPVPMPTDPDGDEQDIDDLSTDETADDGGEGI